jgi:hypothetical protein
LLIVDEGGGVDGKEGICTMAQHCHSKLAHDGISLQVQILEHGVAVPSTNHPNGVVIDATAHERHGSARA